MSGHLDHFMHLAIRQAMTARGHVEPNPMVGCVIVKDADTTPRVIGTGHHARVGGAHAEPTALASCTEDPRGATAVVTLEPCCHTNKRTPPCVPALIRAGIAHVAIGAIDPNPDVNGQGIAQLRAAGIQVTTDVLSQSCNQLLASFIATTRHRRPYITLKWAETADGKISGPAGQRLQISCPESTAAVHALRGRCDAILIGGNTLRTDNPLLTARTPSPPRQPVRIVLTTQPLPREAHLAQPGTYPPVLTFALPDSPIANRKSQIENLLRALCERGITHLLIEPGPALADLFFATHCWDRAWVIRSPVAANAPTATKAPPAPANPIATTILGTDTLTEYLNPASQVYFAPDPSADFLLTSGQIQSQINTNAPR
jgi:diaminohydroxyphosphoribosylaminopyrimidine deaminase/5-amino-6-(5-phosphoribosylamino)uracil reductase